MLTIKRLLKVNALSIISLFLLLISFVTTTLIVFLKNFFYIMKQFLIYTTIVITILTTTLIFISEKPIMVLSVILSILSILFFLVAIFFVIGAFIVVSYNYASDFIINWLRILLMYVNNLYIKFYDDISDDYHFIECYSNIIFIFLCLFRHLLVTINFGIHLMCSKPKKAVRIFTVIIIINNLINLNSLSLFFYNLSLFTLFKSNFFIITITLIALLLVSLYYTTNILVTFIPDFITYGKVLGFTLFDIGIYSKFIKTKIMNFEEITIENIQIDKDNIEDIVPYISSLKTTLRDLDIVTDEVILFVKDKNDMIALQTFTLYILTLENLCKNLNNLKDNKLTLTLFNSYFKNKILKINDIDDYIDREILNVNMQ